MTAKSSKKRLRWHWTQMRLDFEVFDNGKLLLDRLNTLNADDIALILSDIEMPVMDGMALLREVKNNAATSTIPFVMNTNMANPSIIDQAKRHGVDYVIHKLDGPRFAKSDFEICKSLNGNYRQHL